MRECRMPCQTDLYISAKNPSGYAIGGAECARMRGALKLYIPGTIDDIAKPDPALDLYLAVVCFWCPARATFKNDNCSGVLETQEKAAERAFNSKHNIPSE